MRLALVLGMLLSLRTFTFNSLSFHFMITIMMRYRTDIVTVIICHYAEKFQFTLSFKYGELMLK